MVHFLVALLDFSLMGDLLKSPLLVVYQELDLGLVELFEVFSDFVLFLLFLGVHPRDIRFDLIVDKRFLGRAAGDYRAVLSYSTPGGVLPSLHGLLILAILVFHELVQAPDDLVAATHLPRRGRPRPDLLLRLREEAGCEDLLSLVLLSERGAEQDLLRSNVLRALLERLVR